VWSGEAAAGSGEAAGSWDEVAVEWDGDCFHHHRHYLHRRCLHPEIEWWDGVAASDEWSGEAAGLWDEAGSGDERERQSRSWWVAEEVEMSFEL